MVLSVAGILAGMALRSPIVPLLGNDFPAGGDRREIVVRGGRSKADLDFWYACGIVLGTAIIALFALFEKRRNDVLAAVEQLKNWKEL